MLVCERAFGRQSHCKHLHNAGSVKAMPDEASRINIVQLPHCLLLPASLKLPRGPSTCHLAACLQENILDVLLMLTLHWTHDRARHPESALCSCRDVCSYQLPLICPGTLAPIIWPDACRKSSICCCCCCFTDSMLVSGHTDLNNPGLLTA